MPYELEMIADAACHTGEGPCWHEAEQYLYWTDIPQGFLYRYDPRTGMHERVYEGRPVAGMTVQSDGRLLLFMDQGSVAAWDGKNLEFIVESIPEEHGNRFNDVLADPEGRVFAGTMSTKDIPGRLYRIDLDGSVHKLLEGTKTSNGMGFTLDLTRFYFTDTGPGEIYSFDYDRTTGDLHNQRVFIKVQEEGGGRPDGMVVDSEGCIWSARWAGSCLVRYSPAGTEIERVAFPTKNVSCPTFGGSDFRDLYVTTAGGQDKAANGELAGALFRFRPNVGGKPKFQSRICI